MCLPRGNWAAGREAGAQLSEKQNNVSDAGWAVLVIMAFIIMACAPDLLWMGGLILFGIWVINGTKRALDEGRNPPGIIKLIEDMFGRKDR